MVFFVLSVLLHLLFFLGTFFFQDFKIPKPLPPVMQIDLVSFVPEPVETSAEPAQVIPKSDDGVLVKTQPEKPKPKPKKISTKKPDVSLKTKPKNLKELMAEKPKKKAPKKLDKPKKQPSAEKVLEKAREKLAKDIKDKKSDEILDALSRLRKTVKEQGKTKGQASNADQKAAYARYAGKGYRPIDIYNMLLGAAIEQEWVFNDILAGMDKKLEVRILIKILKTGEIRDIIYETKSGNRYLDESAKKAIRKASPLPELPAGLYSYDVVVGFTPRGLK
ncbi:MAG: TonB C-terminal domain-containing protein [Desulfobacteraceae bacterium]|nr:TonB C-terminal domain-containing protein [Desulfobacteraceae bacterium]